MDNAVPARQDRQTTERVLAMLVPHRGGIDA